MIYVKATPSIHYTHIAVRAEQHQVNTFMKVNGNQSLVIRNAHLVPARR